MRILVTGGGGQLASSCERLGRGSGLEVRALPVDDLDVTDPVSIEAALAAEKPDVVLNAAAYTAVDAAEDDEASAHRVNGEAVGLLAAACRDRGVRFAHISTDFVFSGRHSEPILPGEHPEPISVYGRSKLEGERRCLEVFGSECLIVRTAWLYASGHRNFVSTMIDLMRSRDEIRVVADQVGTPTWADTLAECSLRMVDSGVTGTHHLTDTGTASWYEFAVAIQDIGSEFGIVDDRCEIVSIPSREFPTRAARPAYSVLDKGSSFDALETSTPHWRTSLRRCLSDWRDPQPVVAP